MLNTLNINLKTDIKTDRPTTLPIKLMSQDKNNNQFILRFTNGGEAVALDDTYTVEVLTKFAKSGASRLTTAKVRQDYATWEFDTAYITQDEGVRNYVYVRKSGNLVVSADANCFVFNVDLSEIDKGAGKVAETYDENYQKHLDEFKDNVNFEEIAQAEQARKEAETLREESYEQKVDTAIVEADVVEKVDNKVTELTPMMNDLTAQLAQTNTRIGNIITTPAGTVSEQEIVDARDTAVSLGENIRGIKTALIEGNLSDEMVTRSLPNGVKNEYLKEGNGYKFIHRVSVSHLWQLKFSIRSVSTEDFLSIEFLWTNLSTSKVNEPNGYDFHNYVGNQVQGGSNYTNHNNFGWYTNSQYISIKVPKAQLTTPDIAGVKKWLQDNQVILLYPLATPSEHVIAETRSANTKELVRVAVQTDENTKEINLLKQANGVTPPSDEPLHPYLEANRKKRGINNLSGIHRFGAWNLPFGHVEYEVASQIITEKGFTFIGIQEYRGGASQTILNHYKNETMPFHYQVENIPNLAVLNLHSLYGGEREAIPLEFYDGYQERVLAKEVVYINGQRCSVYNVHLDVNRYAMVEQVADCVTMLNADPNPYKVILGDFNAYGKETFDAFTDAGYKISNGKNGVWHKTFKVDNSEATSYKDNIIVSANIDIVHFEVLMYGDELSDHNMLIADLAFN